MIQSWYCGLCRQYGIKNRDHHLKKEHNATGGSTNFKKISTLMIDAIFQEIYK